MHELSPGVFEEMLAPDGTVIFGVGQDYDDCGRGPSDGDARLIAAAPEMDLLLRDLVDESEAHMIGTNLGRARALLAKIDGPGFDRAKRV